MVYFEVVLRTVLVAARFWLVRVVLAVDGGVAVPVLGDADAGCLAPELFVGALVGVQGWAAKLEKEENVDSSICFSSEEAMHCLMLEKYIPLKDGA